MAKRKTKAYKRKMRMIKALIRLAVAVILIIAVIVVAVVLIVKHAGTPKEEAVAYNPGPPSPAIESTASIAATGDILLHNSVLNGAYDGTEYDFSSSFDEVAAYWSAYDYMIVNLEVPCGGDGYASGYPTFDAPDEIVRDLKEAGVDMCLTATNHAYDCRTQGLLHTQEVLDEYGLDHVGTRTDIDESFVLIKDINGIKFGFACYTYDTRSYADSDMSLNGITLSEDAYGLVNSFCYSDLDTFYDSVAEDLDTMEEAGCDVTIFFVHWGDEYTDNPNGYQEEMSQKMADLGVDVIIGGHPHVIQKFDVLTGEEGNQTYCLYSMGNAISSQRKSIMTEDDCRGYTEDGITFSVSYEKFNNGKVKLTGVSILPTWVEVEDDGVFKIIPLDQSMLTEKWQTNSLSEAIASYNRTLGRVGEMYPTIRAYLGMSEVKTVIE